jgi:hypothetical protein
MAGLHDRILALIAEGRWGLTWHANESIQDRGLEIWHVVGLTPEGELLREVPDAKPRGKAEVRITLPDGTYAKAVWGYDRHLDRAILITVHFFEKG